jgi:hypothetical protein
MRQISNNNTYERYNLPRFILILIAMSSITPILGILKEIFPKSPNLFNVGYLFSIGVILMYAYKSEILDALRFIIPNKKIQMEKRYTTLSMILFFTVFILLNSSILITSYTGIDMYGFFDRYSKLITLTLNVIINTLLAILATLIFQYLYIQYERKDKSWRSIPITSSTFKLVFIPLIIVYIPIAIMGNGGIYYLEAFFPFALAFLAIIGYTHPSNKVELFIFKLLLVTCVICMVSGFILASIGLLFVLKDIKTPTKWESIISSKEIDWAKLNYSQENFKDEYKNKFRTGFSWKVIIDMIYLEFIGVITTLIIYSHQRSCFQHNSAVVRDN